MSRVKTTISSLPLLLLMALALGWLSQAQAKQDYVEVKWDNLELSTQQRSSLDELDDQWRDAVSEVAPRIQMNEKRLKQLMARPNANEAEILRLQQAIHEDKTKLKIEATQIFLNKRKVLNKQQQNKLQKMLNLH